MMDHQQLKEYTQLNLRRNGLKIEDADKQTAAQYEQALSDVRQVDRNWICLPAELQKKRANGGFYFSSMGLAYWALLVCLPLFALFLEEHINEGTTLMLGEWFFVLAYILPAIFLVVRLFVMFSFINIAHLILLIACAVLSVLKIRIFGSEVNWMWVFVAAGTLLTLLGRVWEYFHKVLPHKKWYKQQVKIIKSGDSAIQNAATLFCSIGASAAAEMAQKFPGQTLTAKQAWFQFQRKLNTGDQPDIPKVPKAATDFIHPKESSDTVRETEERTFRTIVTITDQSLGYQHIDRSTAINKFISPGKVQPFFGMAVAEHSDDLQYHIYAHRWNETVEEQIQNHFVQTTHVRNKAKQQAEWDVETVEWRYLGTSAQNAQLHSSSWGEHALYQDYLNKKKAMLDRIPDTIGIQHYNTESHKNVRHSQHFEIALLSVTTADGSLVGLYSGLTEEAISFSAMAAKQFWGTKLTAAACPSGDVQKAYLYHNFIL